MGRLVLMLLVTLLRNGETLTEKTAGRNVDNTIVTAAVETKRATDSAASPLTTIAVDTTCGAVSLRRNEAMMNVLWLPRVSKTTTDEQDTGGQSDRPRCFYRPLAANAGHPESVVEQTHR